MAFTIEITANDDQTYTVTSEPEMQEAAEGEQMQEAGGAEQAMGEAPGQTFKSVKECLTVVLAGLKNGGQLPDMAKQNAAFDEGFNGGPQAGGDLGKMRGGM